MSKINIPKILIDVIKKQALSSENEVYGWLIGYQKNNILNILAIIECKKFEFQTVISAIPHAQEFQEISSVLPQGIGPIGIYHSHPFLSKIFHSHTDDSTLISLSKQFPSCVSIVTNGKEVNYYQLNENDQTTEIPIKFIETEVPKFLLIAFNETLSVRISKEVINNLEKPNLNIRILNALREYFESIWNDMELYCNNVEVLKDENIKQYLRTKLRADPIKLKIPLKLKSNGEIRINLSRSSNSSGMVEDNDNVCLKMKIPLKLPIYIHDKNKKFHKIDQIIKTELISNNILQKVYNCSVDLNNKEIITPKDFFLNYFGFFMRILCFDDKKLNKNRFSGKIFEFLSRLLSIFDNFEEIELSENTKHHLQVFFDDIEKLSYKFYWQDDMNEILMNFRNLIN